MADHTNPRITVIVPVFNTEKYIEECLLSILNQNYDNLELIVIDDGSTDRSPEILEKLKEQHHFTLHRQENSGQSAARNYAMQLATGDYLFFIDSDDLVQENTLFLLAELIKRNQDLDLIRFNAEAFVDGVDESIHQEQYDFGDQLEQNKVYEKEDKQILYQTYSAPVWLYCVKRKLLQQHQLSFEEGIIHEDELFTTKLFLIVERFGYINEAFYRRRYRENSTMTNEDTRHHKKSFDSYAVVVKEAEKLLQNEQLTEEQKEFVNKRIKGMLQVMFTRNIDKSYKSDQLKQLDSYTMFEKMRLTTKKLLRKV